MIYAMIPWTQEFADDLSSLYDFRHMEFGHHFSSVKKRFSKSCPELFENMLYSCLTFSDMTEFNHFIKENSKL